MDNVSFAAEACAAFREEPPRVALLLVGNFRTFAEPRVYKSLRRNLIDAFGGQTAAFIYGKLDHEHHGAALQTERNKDFKVVSYARRLAAVQRAVDYLSAAGGADVTRVRSEPTQPRPHEVNFRCLKSGSLCRAVS